MQLGEKIRAALWTVAHSLASVVALFCAGFTIHLFRPVFAHTPSNQFANSPITIGLALTMVALSGAVLYGRWRERHAFFAWAIPAVLCFHLLVTRDRPDLWRSDAWEVALTFLEAATAYSVGAFVSAMIFRRHAA